MSVSKDVAIETSEDLQQNESPRYCFAHIAKSDMRYTLLL